jgi:hypothetical protein
MYNSTIAPFIVNPEGEKSRACVMHNPVLETGQFAGSHVQECLNQLGLSAPEDLDVLVFLYRHVASLANAEQIAGFLGYSPSAVGDALDRLESHKLVQRSRPSRGVRLFQVVLSEGHFAPEGCFRRLMTLAETRSGRLLLVNHLRQKRGPENVGKEKPSDRNQSDQDRRGRPG